MPTIMTHAAVPVAAALMIGPKRLGWPIIITGAVFAILPDADVIGLKAGIAYAEVWGHRGASHSLVFAAIMAALAIAVMRPPHWFLGYVFLFLAMASHGLLDMLTNGGLGAAILWPFDNGRYFWPVTPVAVSPIGVSNFLSARGARVLLSELIWIILPLAMLVAGAKIMARGAQK